MIRITIIIIILTDLGRSDSEKMCSYHCMIFYVYGVLRVENPSSSNLESYYPLVMSK